MNRIDPGAAMEPTPEPDRPTAKMTTAKVFAIFASAWPRTEVTEPTLNLWAHQIGHLSERVAVEAATTIVRTSEWWPTIRRFIEQAEAIRRRDGMRESRAELPEARNFELGHAYIVEIREQIASRPRREDEADD